MMGVLIKASPNPVSPVTIPASNAANNATTKAAINKIAPNSRSQSPC